MHKKALWTPADILYWFFYIPFTVIILTLLIYLPTTIMENSVQPVALDAVIFEQRAYAKLTDYNPITGTNFRTLNVENAKPYLLTPTRKRFGYRLTAGNFTKTGDSQDQRDFYTIYSVYAGEQFPHFTRTFSFKDNNATIQQTYPQRYETFS